MIVRNFDEIEKATFESGTVAVRFLLASDGMGFTLTDAILPEGLEAPLWYKDHLEACYVIAGEGEVEVLEPGPHKIYKLKPGILYALNKHDKHILRVTKKLRLISVFNPPLSAGTDTQVFIRPETAK